MVQAWQRKAGEGGKCEERGRKRSEMCRGVTGR